MRHYLVLILLISTVSSSVNSEDAENIVNLEIISKIDLKKQIVQISNGILFTNNGSDVIKTYSYVINETGLYNIAFYNQEGDKLDFKKIISSRSHGSNTHFEVYLDEDIYKGEKYRLFCKLTYPDKILPVYKTREIGADQLLKFETHARFYSAYYTEDSVIEYRLNNESFVLATEVPSYATINGTTLRYIYQNTSRFDSSRNEIVFVNNEPFLVIKNIRRTIDIYHFGKIAIEDEVIVQNNGPRLVGPYVSHLLAHISPRKAVTTWLYTHLPSSAYNIQFFDILGNNSGTRVHRLVNYVTLKFKTRYPLVGGWKSSYILRYSVPLYEHLYKANGSFFLKIRAVDYVLDGKLIEDATVKVVLPEGSKVKNVTSEVLDLDGETTGCPGGLCVLGRRIIGFTGKNLFDSYIKTINLEYSLNSWYLLRAPLVLSAYLEAVFVTAIVGRRILSKE